MAQNYIFRLWIIQCYTRDKKYIVKELRKVSVMEKIENLE